MGAERPRRRPWRLGDVRQYGCCSMVTHMKTTVEISDALLAEARSTAERRGVTLRTLIEEGLRHAVKTGGRRQRFTLRDASFMGEGLQVAHADGDWERIRDAAYEGRGA